MSPRACSLGGTEKAPIFNVHYFSGFHAVLVHTEGGIFEVFFLEFVENHFPVHSVERFPLWRWNVELVLNKDIHS